MQVKSVTKKGAKIERSWYSIHLVDADGAEATKLRKSCENMNNRDWVFKGGELTMTLSAPPRKSTTPA